MMLWEWFGAVLWLGLIIGGMGVAESYKSDLLRSVGASNQQPPARPSRKRRGETARGKG